MKKIKNLFMALTCMMALCMIIPALHSKAAVKTISYSVNQNYYRKLPKGTKVNKWKSTNTSVAQIKNGKIYGKKAGKATITINSTLKLKITVKKSQNYGSGITEAVIRKDCKIPSDAFIKITYSSKYCTPGAHRIKVIKAQIVAYGEYKGNSAYNRCIYYYG